MIPVAVFTHIDAGTASSSPFQRTVKNVHDDAGILFTFVWNLRSRCAGNRVHQQPEYALNPLGKLQETENFSFFLQLTTNLPHILRRELPPDGDRHRKMPKAIVNAWWSRLISHVSAPTTDIRSSSRHTAAGSLTSRHVPRVNYSILFHMHAARRMLPILVLVGLTACSTSTRHEIGLQVAFLNHSFAVVDQATVDAIEQSDYLRHFGVFNVHTTHADGGESWTARYLMGRRTYLELFGPKDGGGDVGTT